MAGDPSLLKFDADTASAEKKLAELRQSLRVIGQSLNTDQARAELVALEKGLDNVEVDLKEARVAAKQFGDSKADIEGVRATVARLHGAWTTFLGIFGVTSIAAIGVAALKTAGDFEQLEARLFTLTGSAEGAAKAFDLITQFAAKTPFQVQEVTDAFARLKAQGVEPTEKILKSVGDTAAANGKSFLQFTEALLDAQTGQFERLKEFGIVSRTEGEKVSFTFRGVTTEVKKSSEAIRGYLLSIGETQFAGAMERQSATLQGAFSNLQDALALLANAFGKSGLSAEVGQLARDMAGLADSSGKAGTGVNAIGKALAAVIGVISPVANAMAAFALTWESAIKSAAASTVAGVSLSLRALAALADGAGADQLAEKLRNAGREVRGLADALETKANLAAYEAARAAIAAADGYEKLKERLSGSTKAVQEDTPAKVENTKATTDNKAAIDALLPKLKEFAEGKRAGAEASKAHTAALKEEIDALKLQADAAAKSAADATKDVESKKARISELESKPRTSLEEDEELFRLKGELFTAENKLAEATSESADRAFEYDEAQQALQASTEGLTGAVDSQGKATGYAADIQAKLAQATKDLEEANKGAATSIASTNEIIETVGENGERKFTNLSEEAGHFGNVMVQVGEDGEKSLVSVGGAAESTAAKVEQVGEAATVAAEKIGQVGDKGDEQVSKVDAVAEAWDRATEAVERYIAAVERADAAVEKHERMVDDGGGAGLPEDIGE